MDKVWDELRVLVPLETRFVSPSHAVENKFLRYDLQRPPSVHLNSWSEQREEDFTASYSTP